MLEFTVGPPYKKITKQKIKLKEVFLFMFILNLFDTQRDRLAMLLILVSMNANT